MKIMWINWSIKLKKMRFEACESRWWENFRSLEIFRCPRSLISRRPRSWKFDFNNGLIYVPTFRHLNSFIDYLWWGSFQNTKLTFIKFWTFFMRPLILFLAPLNLPYLIQLPFTEFYLPSSFKRHIKPSFVFFTRKKGKKCKSNINCNKIYLIPFLLV